MKKLLSLFVALTAVISLSAKTLYLNPGVWGDQDGRFAVYTIDDEGWANFAAVEGEEVILSAEIPATTTKVVICRMDATLEKNEWESVQNQTEDLTIPEGKDLVTIVSWGESWGAKCPAEWSKYGEEPQPEPAKYFMKHNFEGGEEWTWKEMSLMPAEESGDDVTYILENVIFQGGGVNINKEEKDEDALWIPADKILAYDANLDPATLEAGDKVTFLFVPELVSVHEFKYGLSAIITEKGEPIIPEQDKYFMKHNFEGGEEWTWKEMSLMPAEESGDDVTYILENVIFHGNGVNINTEEKDEDALWIPTEYILAYDANLDPAVLEAGDKVTFLFVPELVSVHEFKYGLSAIITEKGEPIVEDWAEILFVEPVAAADLAPDATFSLLGSEFAVTIADTENKMSIDANKASFGTVEDNMTYTHRLKTGGKSLNGDKKNFITINVPADGKLRLAVRSGNKDATDRNLVLSQNGIEIYNEIVKDADAIVIPGEEGDTKIYPYIVVEVKKGIVDVTFPVNSLNFYAFAFSGEEEPIEPVLADGFYLIGQNGWNIESIEASDLFEANPEVEGEFLLQTELIEGQGIKVAKVENDAIVAWYPDGLGNEYVVDANHAADVKTIYFRPDGQGGEGWYLGLIFIEENDPQGLFGIDAEGKAVKVMMNGQFMIIKNGKAYNATGALVK